MLTYATEPPPLVADLSHTHAQYLPFKRSILRAERTKKSSVRNSRVLSVQVHDAHTQQVMTFTTEMYNKPLTQTYMFRLQKCRFSNAIVPLLHTNSAAITHQKRHYYTPKAPLLENKGVISSAKHHKNGMTTLYNQNFICNTFLLFVRYLHNLQTPRKGRKRRKRKKAYSINCKPLRIVAGPRIELGTS